jgi:hypothetical protein
MVGRARLNDWPLRSPGMARRYQFIARPMRDKRSVTR